MKKLLLKWLVLAVSVVIAGLITQALGLGFEVHSDSASAFIKLMLGVAVLSFFNATIGPILKFMTLPIRCITLGLFSLVVNAIILWLAATFELGFKITQGGVPGFLAALVASLLISAINGALGVLVPDDKDD